METYDPATLLYLAVIDIGCFDRQSVLYLLYALYPLPSVTEVLSAVGHQNIGLEKQRHVTNALLEDFPSGVSAYDEMFALRACLQASDR